jgi:hypothetical protein
MKRGPGRLVWRLLPALFLLLVRAGAGQSEGMPATENAGRTNNNNGRLVLDPAKVLAVQMQALEDQRQEPEDRPVRDHTPFTRWMDRTHEQIFLRLDNAVRNLDTRWLPEGTNYNYKVSTFRLTSFMRAGGRSNEKDYEFKVRFRGRLALPGLERELFVFIDNSGRDSLPGKDVFDQESDTRIGLRSVRDFVKASELALGGGLRLRSTGPVAYGDLEWRMKWDMAGGELRLVPRGFYYTDDGFGQMTTLAWTRPTFQRQKLQLLVAERSTETTGGLEFEQTVRYAWYRSGRGRGWVAQASVFPHMKNSKLYWDNALVNLTWRDSWYRKWMYYSITPQIEFPEEDHYRGKASLRIGLQILFGGQIAEIL